MEENSQVVNQTHFSFEEPLFEQPPSIINEEEKPVETPQLWYKKKLILAAIASGLLLILLLLGLAAYFSPQSQHLREDLLEVQPSPVPELTPNQIKIKELQTELETADPARQEFPFPPVLMEITLPDPNRR